VKYSTPFQIEDEMGVEYFAPYHLEDEIEYSTPFRPREGDLILC